MHRGNFKAGKWSRYVNSFYDAAIYLSQNYPLYLRTASPQDETDLHFQYLVHTSIDVIEEKSGCLVDVVVLNKISQWEWVGGGRGLRKK